MKILIDCGHNYSDTWQKMSPIRKDGTRFYEYMSNRTIGKMLAQELSKLGIAYEYINNPDDANDMPLEKRVSIANNIAKKEGKSNVLYLSLHSDAYGNGNDWYDDIRGYSIYSSKGKTKSDEYAKIFLEHEPDPSKAQCEITEGILDSDIADFVKFSLKLQFQEEN